MIWRVLIGFSVASASAALAQPIEVPLNKELIIRGGNPQLRFVAKANAPGGKSCQISCETGEQIWFMECNNRRPPVGESVEVIPRYKANTGLCESTGEMGDSCRALCVKQ